MFNPPSCWVRSPQSLRVLETLLNHHVGLFENRVLYPIQWFIIMSPLYDFDQNKYRPIFRHPNIVWLNSDYPIVAHGVL